MAVMRSRTPVLAANGVLLLVLLFSVHVALAQTPIDFEDVPEGHFAERAIVWSVEEGITVGVGGNRFGIGQTLTRYQMVTFLCRAYDPSMCRSGTRGSDRFTDVPVDHWANYAIGWAISKGITSGVSAAAFGGPRTLTREEAITLLFRANGSPVGGSMGSDIYADVPADRSQWANQPIGWAYDQGINDAVRGGDPSVFGFGSALVREEMVLFLCRALAPDVCAPAIRSTVSVQLEIASERSSGYDRNEWGPHRSALCRGAVGSADPYTDTTIDTCHVDHVVALYEAHESGGWAWAADKKRRFSQDSSNHVASRACVNQSKGGDDIAEWSDADIASSSACGGYTVTTAGRCYLARVTVAVKSAHGLTVDQAEADALSAALARCGDEGVGFSAGSQDTTVTTRADTTVTTAGSCVISGKSAAEYESVFGIGETLADRLVRYQPFSSVAALEAVERIGPVKAKAVWSHFC